MRAVGGHINQTVYFSVGNLGKTNSEKDQIIEQHAKRLTQQEKRFSEQDARLERLEVILHKKTEQKLEIDEKCSYSVKFHGVKNEDELVNGKSRLYDEVPYDDDDDVKVVDKTVDFQGKPVVLTLESGTNIAYGTIVSNNGYPLPNNCMHVAIDSAMDESAPLPVQDRLSGCQSIGDAVGNHVAWPVQLIKMHDKKHDRKKVALPQKKSDNELQAESMPTSLWVLYCFAKNVLVDGRGIRIPIQSDVFGDDSIIHIYLDDILPFCKLEPISYNCIVGYICTLYKKMKTENKVHKFRFADPYHVGHQPSIKTDKKHRQSQLKRRTCVLAERLSGTPLDTLVLVPFNVGFHWIMTAIFPHKEIVCLMDPLYGKCNRDEDWYHVVNMALKIFNADNRKRGKNKPTWEMLKVPEQSDELQCGFFVLQYMREIIQKGVASVSEGSLQQIFNQAEYSPSDIDEVRVEWT